MLYFLSSNEKDRCPHSSFKGKANLQIAEKGLFLDKHGFPNSTIASYNKAVVLGSSVVFGGYNNKTLTGLMNQIDGNQYYNCSCGSWMTSQAVNQYIYNIAISIPHERVILLVGYNDIFGPISYDPRGQFPYNFFIDECLHDSIVCREVNDDHSQLAFGFGGNTSTLQVDAKIARNRALKALSSQSYIEHAQYLCVMWINALNVMRGYCLLNHIELHIVPQLTILDRRYLAVTEEIILSNLQKYYEVFRIYRARYLQTLWKYHHLFSFVDINKLVTTHDPIFTDQVHLTPVGYDLLASSLCSLVA